MQEYEMKMLAAEAEEFIKTMMNDSSVATDYKDAISTILFMYHMRGYEIGISKKQNIKKAQIEEKLARFKERIQEKQKERKGLKAVMLDWEWLDGYIDGLIEGKRALQDLLFPIKGVEDVNRENEKDPTEAAGSSGSEA